MAHPNIRPYPLPFPNEFQRTQLTMYMPPASAFDTDAGHVNRQTPRTKCDAVADAQNIYLKGPPVSNPSYPYPARNVFKSSTYPIRTPPSVSSTRSPSISSIAWDEKNDQIDQHKFSECVEFPAIHFTRKGHEEPYSLRDLLTMDSLPDLVAGDSPILIQNPDRWIKVKLIWPGYSRFPFEKRIPIKQSAPLTPSLLLMALANHIEKFARWIHNEGIVVEPGQERWKITGVAKDASVLWRRCVVTSLQRRTGSIWQPEIYLPRG